MDHGGHDLLPDQGHHEWQRRHGPCPAEDDDVDDARDDVPVQCGDALWPRALLDRV